MSDASFCAPVGLFLIKLNHYFNVPIDKNVFLLFNKVTLKTGDSAPLKHSSAWIWSGVELGAIGFL